MGRGSLYNRLEKTGISYEYQHLRQVYGLQSSTLLVLIFRIILPKQTCHNVTACLRIAMRAESFKDTGDKIFSHSAFRCNLVIFWREGGKKTKYGKGGTFASAGIKANEKALLTYWDT